MAGMRTPACRKMMTSIPMHIALLLLALVQQEGVYESDREG